MKWFKKDKDGNLIPCTMDDLRNPFLTIYNEDGTTVSEGKVADPPAKDDLDPVKTLSDQLKDLVAQVEGLGAAKEAAEKATADIAKLKEAAAKGFPLYTPGAADAATSDEFEKQYGWKLDAQGRDMLLKLPGRYQALPISKEKHLDMARYWSLFITATCGSGSKQLRARDEISSRYGKTAIGDSGNVFPVPAPVEEEILAFAREASVIMRDGRDVPMTSEFDTFPSETGQSSVAWGNTTANSDPTITDVDLTAYELSAYTIARNSQLMDARSDIVSWLTAMMGEAKGQELDNSAFNGDGTSTYGYCSGILSAAAGFSVVMASGSTAFSQITATLLSEMIGDLDGVRKEGAKFYMNGSVFHFVRSLRDTNDAPIFIPNIGGPMTNTIWGYPYSEVIKAPSTSAANTAFLAFGNCRYFLVGRRLDSTALMLDPYGLFLTNRTRFKLYSRWALKIGLGNGFCRLLTAAQ